MYAHLHATGNITNMRVQVTCCRFIVQCTLPGVRTCQIAINKHKLMLDSQLYLHTQDSNYTQPRYDEVYLGLLSGLVVLYENCAMPTCVHTTHELQSSRGCVLINRLI